MKAVSRLAMLPVLCCALFALDCARDAPEGLAAQRFDPPEIYNSEEGPIYVGVTSNGLARARIELSMPSLGQGVAGARAYLSEDSGATWGERRPRTRCSNEDTFILLDDLKTGTSYQVKLVTVSNLGLESDPPTTAWDNDDVEETPPVPILVEVPAAGSDPVPPELPYEPIAEWQGDGVGVMWDQSSDVDTYGYQLERATNTGGPWSKLTTDPLLDAAYPHFRDVSAQSGNTYYYRVTVEDLSGNLSEASGPSAGVSVP